MTDVIPRRPVHCPELALFWRVVREAIRARLTRADFLPPQVVEEHEVLVYCVNPGGAPGKRYAYESGWLEAFRRDLFDCYFLAP